VATIEGTYNRQNNHDFADPNALALSEAQLFFCGGPVYKCRTNQWWPEDALLYCAVIGLAARGAYAYPATAGLDDPSQTWCHLPDPADVSALRKIRGVTKLTDIAQMKDWISRLTGGPIVAVMVQYEDFQTFGDRWASTNPGAENANVYAPEATVTLPGSTGPTPNRVIGGHVLSIIGYNSTDPDRNKHYWICKNSWGSAWNGNGYVRIRMGRGTPTPAVAPAHNCFIDAIDVRGVTL